MKIDRKLNLVVTADAEDGSKLHVHSQPLSDDVFETYWQEMCQAFTGLMASGLGTMTGPRAAYLMLKRVSENVGSWDGEKGVEAGLVGEIRRLTSVIALTDAGWKPVPLDIAVAQKRISRRDLSEVMGQIVFSTLISSVPRASEMEAFRAGMVSYWGALFVSSTSTEFASSLKTSIGDGSSGEAPKEQEPAPTPAPPVAPGSFTVS